MTLGWTAQATPSTTLQDLVDPLGISLLCTTGSQLYGLESQFCLQCPRHPALPSHFQMPRPLLGPSSLEPISHPCVHSCGSSSPLRKKKKSVKKHRRDRYPSSPGAFSHFMGPRTRALMIRVPESPQAGSREPFHGPTGLILGPGGRDGTGEW